MGRQPVFRCVDSALPQLYCLKFSFKLVDISKGYSMRNNERGCFFMEHMYTNNVEI